MGMDRDMEHMRPTIAFLGKAFCKCKRDLQSTRVVGGMDQVFWIE